MLRDVSLDGKSGHTHLLAVVLGPRFINVFRKEEEEQVEANCAKTKQTATNNQNFLSTA